MARPRSRITAMAVRGRVTMQVLTRESAGAGARPDLQDTEGIAR
jgi:hypothetical protein